MRPDARRAFLLGSAVLLSLLAGPPLATAAAVEAAERSTLVKRPGWEREVAASGGVVLEDYGGFVLLERPASSGRSRPRGAAPVGGIRLAERAFAPGRDGARLDPRLVIGDDYAPGTSGLYLVRFYGPPREEWLDALQAAGGAIVDYVPQHTYVVKMTPEARRRVAAGLIRGTTGRAAVEWTGVFQPADRLAARLARRTGPVAASLLVLDDDAGRALLERLQQEGAVLRAPASQPPYVHLVATLPAERLPEIAREASLYRIDEWTPPVPLDEAGALNVAGMRVNGEIAGYGLAGVPYMDWLASRGFDVTRTWDFAVNVSDTGFDKGLRAGAWHPDLYDVSGAASRVAFVKDWTPDAGTDLDGVDGDGHGTNCAGVVGGFTPAGGVGSSSVSATGYRFGLGVAPNVRLGGSKLFDAGGNWGLTQSYAAVEQHAYAQGARLSSNSWGANQNSYTADARAYDLLARDASPAPGNQPMILLFAAGNSGPGAGTINTPGTAKNVITLGAAEAFWPSYQACGWPSSMQNTPGDDIVYYSSRGPAHDGRVKPDLAAIAHGWVTLRGSAAGVGCGAPYDTADPARYRNFNGTSAATPAAAGAAALFYQHALATRGAPPSPALVKAALIASARDLAGGIEADSSIGTGPPIAPAPSPSQGWGLIDTGRLFDGSPALAQDQAHLFTATGQEWLTAAEVVDPARPVRVVLAWTDAPGNVGAAALKNDLDLEVEAGGAVYLGNVLPGGASATGGSPDRVNNVEVVVLPAGAVASLRIQVRAAALVGDGVPGNGTPLDQDFALYVHNADECAPPDPPAQGAAAASGPNAITVTWQGAPDAPGFVVERAFAAGGPYARIATLSAGTSSYVDTSVSGGTRYYYVVRAAGACESAPTAPADALATGRCTLPPDFAGLASAANAGTAVCAIQLAWPAAAARCGGPVSYDIFRGASSNFVPGPSNRIASGVAGTSWSDAAGLVSGTDYTYVVRAVDGASGSADANAVRRTASALGPVGAPVTFSWSGPATVIPDAGAEITRAVQVGTAGRVASALLTVSITHTWRDDLSVALAAPDGTRVTAHNRTGGQQDHLRTSYDVPTLSDGPGSMASFAGASSAGAWTLAVADHAPYDVGTLDSFSLRLTIAGACAAGTPPPPTEASPLGETRVLRGPGTSLILAYAPSGFASDTTVYLARAAGPGAPPPWTRAFCGLGTSGMATFDPGTPEPGTAFLLVPVGNDGTREGSYGRGSSGAERPEATGLECDFLRAALAPAPAAFAGRPRPLAAALMTALLQDEETALAPDSGGAAGDEARRIWRALRGADARASAFALPCP